MEQAISGTELLIQLEQSYFELRNTLAELEFEDQTNLDLGDGWTPIALLAHIAFWDTYQRRRMEAALAGETEDQRFPHPGEKNEERLSIDRLRSWESVADEADAARNLLIMFVRDLKDDLICAPLDEGDSSLYIQGRVRQLVHHTEEHYAQLKRALEDEPEL